MIFKIDRFIIIYSFDYKSLPPVLYLNFGIYNKIKLAMGHNLSRMERDWKVKNYNAFIRLAPNSSAHEVEKKIAGFLKKYNPNRTEILHLMPAWKVHLYNPDGSPFLLKYIYIFSLIYSSYNTVYGGNPYEPIETKRHTFIQPCEE